MTKLYHTKNFDNIFKIFYLITLQGKTSQKRLRRDIQLTIGETGFTRAVWKLNEMEIPCRVKNRILLKGDSASVVNNALRL